MNKLLNVLKWSVTLGREPQSFLGAGWIPAFLKRVPGPKKRLWALRILSLSPHYFFDGENTDYKGMRTSEYLEAVFRINADSRVEIYEKLLRSELEKDFVVIDYGCGPGFLAKATAPHVRKIYALDISAGALECARILNSEPNIEYILADESGLDSIPDILADAVYSFAVVQHLGHEALEEMLAVCRRKLRPGGKLLLHIQLSDEIWSTEEDWKSDRTLKGKIKNRYGLHCFGRSEEEYRELISNAGFDNIELRPLADFFPKRQRELASQRWLIATAASTHQARETA